MENCIVITSYSIHYTKLYEKNILLLIFVNIFLTSCNEEPVSNSFYQDSYDLWRSHNIHNYSVYQKRTCFCPDAGQLMKITVRSDTVYNVTRVVITSYSIHYTKLYDALRKPGQSKDQSRFPVIQTSLSTGNWIDH